MSSLQIWEASPLFETVQRSRILADGKTFVDCVPRRPLEEILADYVRQAGQSGGGPDLRKFVEENFELPESRVLAAPGPADIEEHIRHLWRRLQCPPDPVVTESSLLALPYPYIVPGGRFREIYYWDSYFTLLGLRESGDETMIEHMARNFASLIRRFGFVPNGNRAYYLGRSQAPYFALIVELLAERRPDALLEFREPLQMEYDFWMDRSAPTRHVVTVPGLGVFNRYYDQHATPRPESFAEDEALGARVKPGDREALFRHLRSAAESGWDFSSRWMADPHRLETIETTSLVPVDLSCLLHRLETVLASAHERAGAAADAARYRQAAETRRRAISEYHWSHHCGYFCDLRLPDGVPSERRTLAGVMPLFFGLASPVQARQVASILEREFLKRGGLVTTLVESGQQWDAPNGWAPLQWLAIRGLQNYGFHGLAEEIARRWVRLNIDTFRRTGQLMEKYNVVDTTIEAGGGEYVAQHGFGWTNGVLLKLMGEYGRPVG